MVKEYLESIRSDIVRLEYKKQEYEKIKAKLLKGVNFDEKSMSTTPSDTTKNVTLQLLKYEEELQQQIAKIIERRKEAIKLIDTLQNPVHIEILTKRFLENKSWATIINETAYSRTMIFDNCRQAIDILEERGEINVKQTT